MTLDLETRTLSSGTGDGCLEVISCSIYDGGIYEVFYLPDYNFNQVELLEAVVEYLKNIQIF